MCVYVCVCVCLSVCLCVCTVIRRNIAFESYFTIQQGVIRPRGYKTCSMLNSTEHKISTALKKLKYRQIKKFLVLRLSDVVFIMLINVKMPTIVGILTFMSMMNSMLS